MILKGCLDCGVSKPLSEFPPAARRRDGRGSYCRPCMNQRSKASYRKRAAEQRREVRERRELPPGFAYCPACNQAKAIADFPQHRSNKSGHHTYCKRCHHRLTTESAVRRHGSTRDKHLLRRYGLTSADVDALIREQGGVCALCRDRKPEHVDHDHVTGRVRGVLCSCCNQGLGNFRDRADILRSAIDYLERTTWQRTPVSTGVYRLTSPRRAARPSPSSSGLQRLISSRRG